MTNLEMAWSYLRQAGRILNEAEHYHREEVWNLVVRRAQEAVEMALKALLRAVGVEIPQVHDVAVFLRQHTASFPESVTTNLDRLVSISRGLTREREASFYGDERLGVPPDQLYTRLDAARAIADARFVVDLCSGVIPRA